MSELDSDFSESENTTCAGNDFQKFFISPPKKVTRETSKTVRSLPPGLAYTSSWVKDTSFDIFPANDVTNHTEFETSDLPSTVGSYKNFVKQRKKEKPASPTTPTVSRIPTISTCNFFDKIARANREIKSACSTTSSKWRVQNGIYMEMENDDESNTVYDELMSLFGKNTLIYSSVSLDHTYSFDWNQYAKGKLQFVVFTKVCQNHEEGVFVEVTKEETKCPECSSESNFQIATRLTIPLDLTSVSLPVNENLGVHVAFLPEKLPNFDKYSHDFTPKVSAKMYNLYRNVVRGKASREYEEWLDRTKSFVKSSLESKSFRLHHGRVVRRKFEELGRIKKRRCFIFADIFDIENS